MAAIDIIYSRIVICC